MKVGLSSPVFYWDLGSLNARLYTVEGGLVSDTNTFLVRDRLSREFVKFGSEAMFLGEKVPSQLEFIQPVQRGRIADPSLSVLMEHMMGSRESGFLSRLAFPIAAISVNKLDAVHRSALKKAASRAGFSKCILIPQGLALSVVSRGIDASSLVCDFGAGKTEFTFVNAGRVVDRIVSFVGGNNLDQAIKNEILFRYGFMVSVHDVRRLKTTLSFASKSKKVQILGKDIKRSTIAALDLDLGEIRELMKDFFSPLSIDLKNMLHSLTPQQVKEIKENGILVSGGLSQIQFFDQWLGSVVGVPIKCINRQHMAALLGMAKLVQEGALINLENYDAL